MLGFVATTMDARIRAFDVKDGARRWQAKLPAFGRATATTCASGGRRLLAIAGGGHGALGGGGDAAVASALPPR